MSSFCSCWVVAPWLESILDSLRRRIKSQPDRMIIWLEDDRWRFFQWQCPWSQGLSNDFGICFKVVNIFFLRCSYISGISLLGTPTEIYIYGTQYMYIIGGIITMGFVMQYVYLPVFHDLKLTSTYHYLAIRFDYRIRMFGSILFAIGMVSQFNSSSRAHANILAAD